MSNHCKKCSVETPNASYCDDCTAKMEAGAAGIFSIFRSLFDVNFNRLLTPILIKYVYILIMIVQGVFVFFGTLFLSILGFKNGFFTGVVFFIAGLGLYSLLALLGLALTRILLEFTMVIFKIKEYTEVLMQQVKPPGSAHPAAGGD